MTVDVHLPGVLSPYTNIFYGGVIKAHAFDTTEYVVYLAFQGRYCTLWPGGIMVEGFSHASIILIANR